MTPSRVYKGDYFCPQPLQCFILQHVLAGLKILFLMTVVSSPSRWVGKRSRRDLALLSHCWAWSWGQPPFTAPKIHMPQIQGQRSDGPPIVMWAGSAEHLLYLCNAPCCKVFQREWEGSGLRVARAGAGQLSAILQKAMGLLTEMVQTAEMELLAAARPPCPEKRSCVNERSCKGTPCASNNYS